MKKKLISKASVYKYLDIPHLTKLVDKSISEFISAVHVNAQDEKVALKVREYIKRATSGEVKNKYLIQEHIKIMLLKTGIDIYEIEDEHVTENLLERSFVLHEALEEVNLIIPFNRPEDMTVLEKFEIILYKYKNINEQGYDEAFKRLVEKYSPLKTITETWGTNTWNEYTAEDIKQIYEAEKIQLTFDEKVDIIVKTIYQQLYGLREIDTLAYCDLNEVGISADGQYVYAWCGEKIRLGFINISAEELRLIQERSTSFDERVGQLDDNNPEVLCHRADNARVTAVQKPFFSTRNLCIRIFNNSSRTFHELYQDDKKRVLVTALAKAGEVISLQGVLGGGKTTTMKSMLGLLDDDLHIGTIEDNFEQHNLTQYPNKRIVEAQITSSKDLMDGIKALLRMSIDVASLGEARDGEAVYAFIQLAQTIGLSAWFTTHVTSPEDTVPRLKNLLMCTGKYHSEQAAISDIVQYINVIFQHSVENGQRDIKDIVEIVPLVSKSSKINYNLEDSTEQLQKLALIQQIQQNPLNMYYLNPLLTVENGVNKFLNYPTERLVNKGLSNPKSKPHMEKLLTYIERDLGYSYEESLGRKKD